MALSAAATPALAQTQPAASPETPWTFSVTPYAWLMGVNGSVTAKGQTLDVNANFIDIVGKTDTLFGLMANMEARKGP